MPRRAGPRCGRWCTSRGRPCRRARRATASRPAGPCTPARGGGGLVLARRRLSCGNSRKPRTSSLRSSPGVDRGSAAHSAAEIPSSSCRKRIRAIGRQPTEEDVARGVSAAGSEPGRCQLTGSRARARGGLRVVSSTRTSSARLSTRAATAGEGACGRAARRHPPQGYRAWRDPIRRGKTEPTAPDAPAGVLRRTPANLR